MIPRIICLSLLFSLLSCRTAEKSAQPPQTIGGIPFDVYIQILTAEDTRQWDPATMEPLFMDSNPAVRARAALAAGRIGDEAVIPSLVELLRPESPDEVSTTAAFAIGEIESVSGSEPLLNALRDSQSGNVRAAAVEGLGKIAAAAPENATELKQRISDAILQVLKEQSTQQQADRHLVLLSLTAALRAKPAKGHETLALFLESNDARVRADALNALARLRGKEALGRIREMLANDPDPLVRANAARALGAALDKSATDALASAMIKDTDLRARVGAIRALAAIGHPDSSGPLLERAEALIAIKPPATNELLELSTALGRVLPNTNNDRAVAFLVTLRSVGVTGPEVEAAYARIAPARYLADDYVNSATTNWQQINAIAAGLTEIATMKNASKTKAQALTRITSLLDAPQTPAASMPDLLRTFQSFAPQDLAAVAIKNLKSDDVIVRSAAADILSELPSSPDTVKSLTEALAPAMEDKQNDAALSIVGALAKVKDAAAAEALHQAVKGPDHLVRRRAIEGLKNKSEGLLPSVGPVNTQNTREDYVRAASRIGNAKAFHAVIATDKGEIKIALNPAEAPLTVDSFIKLAQSRYFDGLTFHRVVANFVVQGGDPRGDGNGGPGYTIRCEINSTPYEAGTIGMALSGKDTGGSQFFITHSPQPHLDGGYTAFGRVVSGQDVVDKVERGDRVRSVVIQEERGQGGTTQ